MSIAIVITVFQNPDTLSKLIDNMIWAGIPEGVPVYVFEDKSPYGEAYASLITRDYRHVLRRSKLNWSFDRTPEWSCMHGVIQYALENTDEDWIVYVPDDVLFSKGGLLNEVDGIRSYGFDFVGGIQAPYWNASQLVSMGIMQRKDSMYDGTWTPKDVPINPHWAGDDGLPKSYINLNGAGFSISRKLFEKMGGWPQCTWRLDEYAGYMAWKLGMAVITLQGPPRIHYGAGGSSGFVGHGYHTREAWVQATGKSPEETGVETRRIMEAMPTESWLDVYEYFTNGRCS